jgi:hypothetical protein
LYYEDVANFLIVVPLWPITVVGAIFIINQHNRETGLCIFGTLLPVVCFYSLSRSLVYPQ